MGSQRCLLRPSVCKSLEQQDARHSPLLDVCFPVERSNLCVFAAVSPRFHPFCRTRPIVPLTFAFFLPLFPSACRQDEDTHCSLFCLLASTSLRIPWEVLSKVKTKVPYPLVHDLPELLATSRTRTP